MCPKTEMQKSKVGQFTVLFYDKHLEVVCFVSEVDNRCVTSLSKVVTRGTVGNGDWYCGSLAGQDSLQEKKKDKTQNKDF